MLLCFSYQVYDIKSRRGQENMYDIEIRQHTYKYTIVLLILPLYITSRPAATFTEYLPRYKYQYDDVYI